MSDERPARLPAHIEVSALIRRVEAAGGFATVLSRGDRDAGTLLLVLSERGGPARVFERMPTASGRAWTCVHGADAAAPEIFQDYLKRRRSRDSDLWILELDAANAESLLPE